MGSQSARDDLVPEAIKEILELVGDRTKVRKPGQLTVHDFVKAAHRSRTRMSTILQELVESGELESEIVFDEMTRHYVRVYWRKDGNNGLCDS